MNVLAVNKTPEQTQSYPLHIHQHWEIMYYTKGEGVLKTDTTPIQFKTGTIIIVPPNVSHGSTSKKEFINISIGGDFDNYFISQKPILLSDNDRFEGKILAELIFKNRYSDNKYLSSLCLAYINFLLLNIEYENDIKRRINEIILNLTDNYTNSTLSTTDILKKSGYAEDYIRNEFKKQTGLTPIKYLTKSRIEHSKRLFQIYGDSVTVSQVAIKSGFSDPVYFSKKFKQFTGVSPEKYRKQFYIFKS